MPRPKEPRASRRTNYPRPDRTYPTRHPDPTSTARASRPLIPAPIWTLPTEQCAPNLPYFVTRSANNELPVYHLNKRGGNLLMTRVKKIDGKKEVLRDELTAALGLEAGLATVNTITGHVMLKGHHKLGVEKFLRERMF